MLNWNVVRTSDLLEKVFDTWFETPAIDRTKIEEKFIQPDFNLIETKDSWIVEAELPGIKKEDIKLDVKDNYLTISGKKESRYEKTEDYYQRHESSYGKFKRSYQLKGLDGDKIEAKYENGVLTVTVPKTPEKEPIKIEVK